MKKTLTITCLLILSLPAVAQEKFTLNKTDAAYWTGASLDVASSLNKREKNPLWRDSQGIFSPGRNLAFKGGLWGAFKVLEWKYDSPKERRIIGWVKIGTGTMFTAFAIKNFGVKTAR